MRRIVLSLLLCLTLLAVCPCYAATWSVVTTITGSEIQVTPYFTITHNEWRVNWTYTPDPQHPEYANFYLYVYSKNGTLLPVDITESGNTTTSGTTNVHNMPGAFRAEIGQSSVISYTVTVEQDIESVPEYPVLLLPFVMTTILVVLILARTRSRFAKRPIANILP